jgi:hypothetical protein
MNNIKYNLLFDFNIVKTFIEKQNNLMIRVWYAQITKIGKSTKSAVKSCVFNDSVWTSEVM